jgi:hypothetical protein
MTNKNTFSKRQGLFSIKEKEITVREDAPDGLRGFIKMVYYDLGKNPSDLRSITIRVLKSPRDCALKFNCIVLARNGANIFLCYIYTT